MFYKFAVALIRPLLYLYFRIFQINRPREIPDGALIVAGNHRTWIDPVLLAICFPRQIHFLAKIEAFDNPLLAYLLKKAEIYPVVRDSFDRNAIKISLETLENQECLGIFPEGTRHKADELSVGELHNGTAYFATKTGTPILPVSIFMEGGSFRSKVYLSYQPLIHVEKTKASKADLAELSEKLSNSLTEGLRVINEVRN